MKKLLVMAVMCSALYATSVQAQQSGDPAAMMQRMKDRIKPQLIEKAKISDAEADKVIEISFNSRQQMRNLRDLPEDERKKKAEAIQTETDKQYKAIPLTDEQVKAVNSFFEEQRKAMQQRQQQNGSGQ